MPPTPQNASQIVSQVNRRSVLYGLKLIKRYQLSRNRWLSPINRYRDDIVERVREDLVGVNYYVCEGQFSQYLAASGILHCFDGWSFLARAFDALLKGDEGTAIHMSYYAELRAAISFLSLEGIGILNSQHIALYSTRNWGYCSGSTHVVAWNILQAWSAEQLNSARLLDLLRFDNLSFAEWIDAATNATSSPTSRLIAKDWLESWSLDLANFEEDRKIRNEKSYRPRNLSSSSKNISIVETIKTLGNIWATLEPSPSDRMRILDSVLLRNALIRTHRSNPNIGDYSSFIDNMFVRLGRQNESLRQFLVEPVGESYGDTVLGFVAHQPKRPYDSLDAFSVLSRALLLLRIASANVEATLNDTKIKREDLQFWWTEVGSRLGFWPEGQEPAEILDIWIDIQEALDSLYRRIENDSTSDLYSLTISNPLDLHHLQQVERVALWAIGL